MFAVCMFEALQQESTRAKPKTTKTQQYRFWYTAGKDARIHASSLASRIVFFLVGSRWSGIKYDARWRLLASLVSPKKKASKFILRAHQL